MNTKLAILLEATAKFKRFALVEYELDVHRSGIRHIVHSRDDWQRYDLVEEHQFLEVPPLCEFHTAINKLAGTYGIMFSSATQKFTVTSFRFGKPCRISVPVFHDDKIDQKFVTTTKHINIVADTYEECSLKLFRICVSGKLHGYYSGGRLERLYWDTEFKHFATEHVSRASISI